ncbi:hypothetical protein [Actinomadura alba]|uniref:Uncharacterized protein n=1 Tax=Actinomadura alba TaxID=406431 RepID=A0ABR7LPH4_9ACTN|nr:hypothetical protein [Actinomadura alba]MBC6466744.1 hypothetical protein [Actinomadura alba]
MLLEALTDPEEVNGWFPERLPNGQLLRVLTLVRTVAERAETFEEVLPTLLALLPYLTPAARNGFAFSDGFGMFAALRARAFLHGVTPGMTLTAAQRSFLLAVVDRLGDADTALNWWYQDPWDATEDRAVLRRLLST